MEARVTPVVAPGAYVKVVLPGVKVPDIEKGVELAETVITEEEPVPSKVPPAATTKLPVEREGLEALVTSEEVAVLEREIVVVLAAATEILPAILTVRRAEPEGVILKSPLIA